MKNERYTNQEAQIKLRELRGKEEWKRIKNWV